VVRTVIIKDNSLNLADDLYCLTMAFIDFFILTFSWFKKLTIATIKLILKLFCSNFQLIQKSNHRTIQLILKLFCSDYQSIQKANNRNNPINFKTILIGPNIDLIRVVRTVIIKDNSLNLADDLYCLTMAFIDFFILTFSWFKKLTIATIKLILKLFCSNFQLIQKSNHRTIQLILKLFCSDYQSIQKANHNHNQINFKTILLVLILI